jgi:hypothetical protein
MGLLNKALGYEPEGSGFDSRSGNWNLSFQLHCGSVVDSASKINEYQGYLVGVKAAGAYG